MVSPRSGDVTERAIASAICEANRPAMTRRSEPARNAGTVVSLVPARLDRLPWSRFHTRLLVALGVAWVLDGLEITIASTVGAVLQRSDTLHLTSTAVGFSATVYLVGEVVGALLFGRLSDRLGRRRLFIATLALYLVANGLTALSPGYGVFLFFRFFAGMGIGGEYAAVNSAIDELIPARHRGQADLLVNGTYWLGAIVGTLGTLVLLNPNVLPPDLGWRIGFFIGPIIGIAIWGLRRNLPESPRWQLTHGRTEEAEETVTRIERELTATGVRLPPVDQGKAITVRTADPVSYLEIARVMFRQYRSRSVLGATLMISQSFLYNAIFFTYVLVLTHFYGVRASDAPWYLLAFAVGNLLGPIVLGRLFDTVGRKQMISGCYLLAGALLALTGFLFDQRLLTATTQTLLWSMIFFFASSAASAAYLTVSEIFPLELRAQAIAFFFAIAQVVGALGPVIFGALIGDREHPDPGRLFLGYLVGAVVMATGGVVEALIGVKAERTSLEDIAPPLSEITAAAKRE
jgi:MFS family permease